jgi:hypothetical protein
MDRPDITIITGPDATNSGSFGNTIQFIYAIKLASIGLEHIACATLNKKIDNNEIGMIILDQGNPAEAILKHISGLEIHQRTKIYHLITAGNMDSKQAASIVSGNFNLHVAYISKGHNEPITDTERVFRQWYISNRPASKSFNHSFVYITPDESLTDQIERLIDFLCIRQIVKNKLIHNTCRDRSHLAYRFIRDIMNFDAHMEKVTQKYTEYAEFPKVAQTKLTAFTQAVQ